MTAGEDDTAWVRQLFRSARALSDDMPPKRHGIDVTTAATPGDDELREFTRHLFSTTD